MAICYIYRDIIIFTFSYIIIYLYIGRNVGRNVVFLLIVDNYEVL